MGLKACSLTKSIPSPGNLPEMQIPSLYPRLWIRNPESGTNNPCFNQLSRLILITILTKFKNHWSRLEQCLSDFKLPKDLVKLQVLFSAGVGPDILKAFLTGSYMMRMLLVLPPHWQTKVESRTSMRLSPYTDQVRICATSLSSFLRANPYLAHL